GRLNDQSFRRAILKAVEHDDANVRGAAMTSLAAMGQPQDAKVVAEGLKDREAEVRVAAVRALGIIGDRDVVAKLIPLTRGLAQPTPVKEAARAAVVSIQSRTGGVRGGLAVVELSEEGGLSEPSSSDPDLETDAHSER
ncbi:MAG: HEAT repeat domain-containing protein, partial [Myxococcota bacterium]